MKRVSPEDACLLIALKEADGSYVVGNTEAGKEFYTLAVRIINVKKEALSTIRRYIKQVWVVSCSTFGSNGTEMEGIEVNIPRKRNTYICLIFLIRACSSHQEKSSHGSAGKPAGVRQVVQHWSRSSVQNLGFSSSLQRPTPTSKVGQKNNAIMKVCS